MDESSPYGAVRIVTVCLTRLVSDHPIPRPAAGKGVVWVAAVWDPAGASRYPGVVTADAAVGCGARTPLYGGGAGLWSSLSSSAHYQRGRGLTCSYGDASDMGAGEFPTNPVCGEFPGDLEVRPAVLQIGRVEPGLRIDYG